MTEKANTAPVCPKCNQPAEFIDYYEFSVWKYNPETDSYDNTSLYGGSAEVQCSQCNLDLGEIFPDGPINYTSSLEERWPSLALIDKRMAK